MKLKYFLVLIFIAFGVLIGFFFYRSSLVEDTRMEETVSEFSAFADKLEPVYAKPVRVFADNVKFNVELVEVGVTEEGTLEAPEDWNVGGWYKGSAFAGALGNLIIDGHYDDNFGRPAAFWGLNNLSSNDTLYVVDAFGRIYPYRVTEMFYVNVFDQARLGALEGDSASASLTLVTCGGVWLPQQATYSERLIVKAVL